MSRSTAIATLETERLVLEPLTEADAPFLVALLTDPDFKRNVGDRGVQSETDVPRYLRDGPSASYQRNGFGLARVGLRDTHAPVGVCGLVRRDGLDDVDLGFAFLPRYRGRGYALEAARRVLRHAFEDLGLARVVAITRPDNEGSIRVLEGAGMSFERMVRIGDEPELRLYALDADGRDDGDTV